MKAVVYNEYAPDDNYAKILKVQDIDDPKPKPDEVIFTNKASALNYNDIWGMTIGGSEYAIIGSRSTIYVIDVTVCSSPVLKYSIMLFCVIRKQYKNSITVYKSTALVSI